MNVSIEIIGVLFAFFTLLGGGIGVYVSIITRLTKLDTRLEYVEDELKEEKKANEKYKSETSEQLKGIYKALTDLKVLIIQKADKK